jgi:prepilin-type processing-associated H-X9-DG protein
VQIFAFVEEHERSIDDGLMAGINPVWVPQQADDWLDLPAGRHNQGCGVTFVDGHVVTWHWKYPKKFQYRYQPAASPTQDPQQNDLRDLRQFQSWIPQNP